MSIGVHGGVGVYATFKDRLQAWWHSRQYQSVLERSNTLLGSAGNTNTRSTIAAPRQQQLVLLSMAQTQLRTMQKKRRSAAMSSLPSSQREEEDAIEEDFPPFGSEETIATTASTSRSNQTRQRTTAASDIIEDDCAGDSSSSTLMTPPAKRSKLVETFSPPCEGEEEAGESLTTVPSFSTDDATDAIVELTREQARQLSLEGQTQMLDEYRVLVEQMTQTIDMLQAQRDTCHAVIRDLTRTIQCPQTASLVDPLREK